MNLNFLDSFDRLADSALGAYGRYSEIERARDGVVQLADGTTVVLPTNPGDQTVVIPTAMGPEARSAPAGNVGGGIMDQLTANPAILIGGAVLLMLILSRSGK